MLSWISVGVENIPGMQEEKTAQNWLHGNIGHPGESGKAARNHGELSAFFASKNSLISSHAEWNQFLREDGLQLLRFNHGVEPEMIH